MPLWSLEPIDLGDRHWNASRFKAAVIIRAESAARAQLLAARAFGIATKQEFGDTVTICPWDHYGFVTVTQVQATDRYAEDGVDGVVHPLEAIELAHRGYDQ